MGSDPGIPPIINTKGVVPPILIWYAVCLFDFHRNMCILSDVFCCASIGCFTPVKVQLITDDKSDTMVFKLSYTHSVSFITVSIIHTSVFIVVSDVIYLENDSLWSLSVVENTGLLMILPGRMIYILGFHANIHEVPAALSYTNFPYYILPSNKYMILSFHSLQVLGALYNYTILVLTDTVPFQDGCVSTMRTWFYITNDVIQLAIYCF